MFNEASLQQFLTDLPQINQTAADSFYHGITHWKNVEKFGLLLAREYLDVDKDVVRWFAYLHDSMRGYDGPCIEHGQAAARYIRKIRNTYLKDLTDFQIELLEDACYYHTITHRRTNSTVNVCFDADRLDLWRVGIRPEPELMATDAGSRYADLSEVELYKLI